MPNVQATVVDDLIIPGQKNIKIYMDVDLPHSRGQMCVVAVPIQNYQELLDKMVEFSNTMNGLPSSNSNQPAVPQVKQCTCDRATLCNKGCQCGAIKPYKQTY